MIKWDKLIIALPRSHVCVCVCVCVCVRALKKRPSNELIKAAEWICLPGHCGIRFHFGLSARVARTQQMHRLAFGATNVSESLKTFLSVQNDPQGRNLNFCIFCICSIFPFDAHFRTVPVTTLLCHRCDDAGFQKWEVTK